MTEYEQGFFDARDSVIGLIDEWYAEYKPNLDNLPLPLALGFLKLSIMDAIVEDA